jgi:RNA polymerase sporulation-specific sigma factor
MRAVRRHLDQVLSDLEHQVLRHHVEGKSYDETMLQRHVKSVDNALQRIKRRLQTHLDERVATDLA